MYTLPKKKNAVKTLILILALFFDTVLCRADSEKLVCGAYIEKNAGEAANIQSYEELCGISNNIYLISIKNTYPKDKILECYANGKIPMLLISRRYSLSSIAALAEAAGEYDLPMYVCIGGDTVYYRYCVDMFRQKTKNTKFVQSIMLSDTVYEFAGKDYADLLAITVTVNENGGYAALYPAVKNADIPVMLNLAVCGYTENGHSYHTFDAIKALDYIYGIKSNLPDKLFGINYINIHANGRNYDIYAEQKLRTVYGGLVCKWKDTAFGIESF
ncbi:MAG: hypothetical protein IJR59_01655 [Firmicutes bacterium]|nr:hypothetical protein [Bacillota bacterium]